MKSPKHITLILGCLFLFACKKTNDITSDLSDPDSLNQSVFYKTVATIPSPNDSAKGLLRDSVSASRIITKADPNFRSNILNVSSNLETNFPGFSLGYFDPNKSLPYFSFTAFAFPDVPREFALNKIYEHTSIRGSTYQKPLFLGSHNGFDAMTYFVNNVYPADAGYPTSRTYTSITFTKKIKILVRTDTILFGSGHIAGYCIDYYHLTDTTKYVHRWDFTVDFTDLNINR